MNVIEHHLFKVANSKQYDKSGNLIKSQDYVFFSSNFLNLKEDEMNAFVDKTIKALKDKQRLIKRLKETSIEEIKKDIKPGTYKIIKEGGITNLYDLRMRLYRRLNGNIDSKIVFINLKKGNEILDVLEKNGIPNNLYTETWGLDEDKAV